MRIALTFLGLDLFTLDFDTTVYEAADPVDGGYTASTPISFYGTHPVPDEAGPYHDGWE